jgi:type II secretory pathway pseudopilin PulG
MVMIWDIMESEKGISSQTGFSRARNAGFSLIEVMIAMGIVVFVLIALLGLLSSGLKVSGQAKTELEAAQLASSLINLRRAAPTGSLQDCPLPSLTNAAPTLQHLFLDQTGRVSNTQADAYYDLCYTISPGEGAARIFLSLSHPARNNTTTFAAIGKSDVHFETVTYVRLP